MERNSRIFVAGHKGLVGSAITRALSHRGFTTVITRDRSALDLLDQRAVHRFFEEETIDYVFLSAAKVGGILYNQTNQADFLYENVTISSNIIHAAAEHGVKKLLYLGSSCIYPKYAEQPIKEEALLTGPLEPTNEGYALAKIVGLKLCEKYRTQYGKRFVSVMPTNLYGMNDRFHPEHSHVIPALMRRFHDAKLNHALEVVIWGTGTPKREFLHVDDLAAALMVVMERYEENKPINIGTGIDCSIAELAEVLKRVVGFKGEIRFDTTKPDGTPRKVLEVSRMKALGWEPLISFEEGLRDTYLWALKEGIFSTPGMTTMRPGARVRL